MHVRLLLALFCFTQTLIAQNTLIPAPVKYQAGKGSFALTAQTGLHAEGNNADAALAARFFQQTVKPGGKTLALKKAASNITFAINKTPNTEIGAEGYTLDVRSTGIRLSANTGAGLFYGVQSLRQLMPPTVENPKAPQRLAITACKITDYPRFAWRGLMLDVSRHFFDKAEVLQFIDLMVRYKYNVFHWHLTDDNGWRIEIKSRPKLTSVGAWRVERFGNWGDVDAPKAGEPTPYGGFYTQDEVREVIQYAAERHITIIPEIDVPGHSMAALAAYPELSCTKVPAYVNPGSEFAEWHDDGTFSMNIENTLNPSDEQVYVFMDQVLTEVAALFPAPYIHIGGDECYKGYWEKDPGCQALMKKEGMTQIVELQSYFNKRLEKILKQKGKKLLGWDEILEGGLAQDATVMSWRGMKGGIEAAKMGHPVVMSPSTHTYLDLYQGDRTVEPSTYSFVSLQQSYSFEPVPDGIDPKLILGGQGNIWTERIADLRELGYMAFPRAWAVAEAVWSPKTSKNWEDFVRRTELQFKRCDAAQIKYSRAYYDAIIEPKTDPAGKLFINLRSEAPGTDIYYSLDDTPPDSYSTHYTGAFEVPSGPVTLKVITYRAGKPLGRMLAVKREELLRRAQ